ncbi:MAG: GNAT family N-acetyltransferase [Psychrobium sp.]|nr:GNAT family N-acetyltransferase [Psychrobium sp.]
MNLKQVSPAQFELVFDIFLENARWLASKYIWQWPLDWLEDKRLEIKDAIDSGHYFSVDFGGELAGIVEIQSKPEELWNNDGKPLLYTHKLAIRRQYADQHLGRQIMSLIEARATQQGIKYLRLDCVAHNAKLRQYYESNGYKLVDEVKASEMNFALYQYEI